jgi:hypothetical protein
MKQTLIMAAMLIGLVSCEKESYTLPATEIKSEQWILNDSVAYHHNCQLIVFKSYVTYLNGQMHQIMHVKQVIGEPCNYDKPQTND